MTEHEQLYQALDTITGGLAAFMAAGRDDTWTCDGWHAFNLTTMGKDALLFGFRARVNGELAPDPQISVRVDHGTRTASIRCVDQLLGYWQVPNIPAGSTGYAIDLLTEMQRRRHLVLQVVDPAGRSGLLVVPLSSSDWRGRLQARAQLRRLARKLGKVAA